MAKKYKKNPLLLFKAALMVQRVFRAKRNRKLAKKYNVNAFKL